MFYLARLFEHLTPYARVFTALTPFLAAIIVRLIFGKNQMTRALLSVGTIWFAMNILVAPYSYSMRQDLINLQHRVFR